MESRRPVKRLKRELVVGSGQAQIIESPKQLTHLLWTASQGEAGARNVAIMWMLFGSGCRINEVAQLKVKDIYYATGELKPSFKLPASYTKTAQARIVYIEAWDKRISNAFKTTCKGLKIPDFKVSSQ